MLINYTTNDPRSIYGPRIMFYEINLNDQVGSQRPVFASYITHTLYPPFPHKINNYQRFQEQNKK